MSMAGLRALERRVKAASRRRGEVIPPEVIRIVSNRSLKDIATLPPEREER